METFDFPYHTVATQNPESGMRVQFGKSYVFTAPPDAPDQRLFTLSFPAMKFFLVNGTLDPTVEPELNMLRLIHFYQEHKLHKSFLYEHPVHGTLVVKFSKPLLEPAGVPGGFGVTEPVDVELMEIP